MFRGNRIKGYKAGLDLALFVAVFFAAALLGYGLWEGAKYERQADTNSRHYSSYTSQKIAETCVAIAPLEKAKCVYEARDQESEYKYNQRDLIAQRQSALWAYIMGLAAVIGMALSALGVWLIKTTFDETRKANDITQESHRPHLIPDKIVATHHFAFGQNGSGETTFIISEIMMIFGVENFGKTHGIIVNFAAQMTYFHANSTSQNSKVYNIGCIGAFVHANKSVDDIGGCMIGFNLPDTIDVDYVNTNQRQLSNKRFKLKLEIIYKNYSGICYKSVSYFLFDDFEGTQKFTPCDLVMWSDSRINEKY